MYTLLYLKWIINKDLIYSTWNSAYYNVAAWMGGKFGGEWIYVCRYIHIHIYIYIHIYICIYIYMAESLHFSPETHNIVHQLYPIQNKKVKINKKSDSQVLFKI